MQASIPCQSARPVTAAPHRSLQQLSSRHTVAHALQPHCARQSRPARLACTPRAAGNAGACSCTCIPTVRRNAYQLHRWAHGSSAAPPAAGNFHTGVAAAGAQLKPELRQALDDFVGQNKIVLFMKGTQQVSRELLCVIFARSWHGLGHCGGANGTLTGRLCARRSSRSAASPTPAYRCGFTLDAQMLTRCR